MKTFGELIAEGRKRAKLTQREFAARIKMEDGRPISAPYLNDLEHNLRHPPRG
jgi:transcriptional regulator with XRE-family HTH domain